MASTTAASAVSHSVGSYLQNFYETKMKNKKQNKTLNDATIESRMTEIERMHTQAIEMVRVVQQQQAKCNWKVTKKKKCCFMFKNK